MELTLILGLIASVMLEIIKFLSKKYGEELSKKIVYSILFFLIFVFTYLTNVGIISQAAITNFLTILSSSVATYHLILKPFKK